MHPPRRPYRRGMGKNAAGFAGSPLASCRPLRRTASLPAAEASLSFHPLRTARNADGADLTDDTHTHTLSPRSPPQRCGRPLCSYSYTTRTPEYLTRTPLRSGTPWSAPSSGREISSRTYPWKPAYVA